MNQPDLIKTARKTQKTKFISIIVAETRFMIYKIKMKLKHQKSKISFFQRLLSAILSKVYNLTEKWNPKENIIVYMFGWVFWYVCYGALRIFLYRNETPHSRQTFLLLGLGWSLTFFLFFESSYFWLLVSRVLYEWNYFKSFWIHFFYSSFNIN